MTFIYRIENTVNKKWYIGKTRRPLARWFQHLGHVRLNKQTYLCRAIRKHGIENFRMILIDSAADDTAANKLEVYYIKEFETYKPAIGYNSTFGGDGVVPTEETIQKNKQSHIGLMAKEKHPMWGKHHTMETKAKISKSRTGTTHENGIHRKDIKDSSVCEMYDSGYSCRKIANFFKVDKKTISLRLNKMKISRRSHEDATSLAMHRRLNGAAEYCQ